MRTMATFWRLKVMAGEPKIATVTVIPFEKFWKWLQGHPNCILSAGTGDVLIHDCEDFHWHFAQEETGDLVVEVIRGKQLVSEMVIVPREISCVQVEPKAEEEFLFECIPANISLSVSLFKL